MLEAAPHAFERSMALMVTTSQMAVAIGSSGGGVIVDHTGLFSAFKAGAALCLIAVAMLTATAVFAGRRSPQVSSATIVG